MESWGDVLPESSENTLGKCNELIMHPYRLCDWLRNTGKSRADVVPSFLETRSGHLGNTSVLAPVLSL